MTNLFISSNSEGVTVDSNGSLLRANLDYPLTVPGEKKCRVLTSNIWYDFPNIIAPNNTVTFQYGGTIYSFVLEQGLYGLSDINERMTELLENSTLPSNLFKLVADESISKISLKVDNGLTSFSMNFEVDNYIFKNLLGFSGVYTGGGSWIDSTNKAKMNLVNGILIHCSFANSGVFAGRYGSDIIGTVPITADPGSQIVSERIHPLISTINETQIDSYTVYLTSENGTPLVTNEPWSLVLELF